MFPRHPEHLKAFDYIGLHRYSLTFCTDARRDLFIDRAAVELVFAQILRAAADEGFDIIAYCFMPDHLHLLIAARSESSDCRAFIKRAKQFSGFYYSKEFKGRLWQRYGYEHTLRGDEATLVVARYLFENPIRAGLAARVEDYPFLGSAVYNVVDIVAAAERT